MANPCLCNINGYPVKDTVARDMVKNLVEINTVTCGKIKFFIGTMEEYEHLTTSQKTNLFAIITDDKTKEEILASIEALDEKVNGVDDRVDDVDDRVDDVESKIFILSNNFDAQVLITENQMESVMNRLSLVESDKATFNRSFIESHDDMYPWLTKGEMYQVIVSIHDGEGYLNSEIIAEFNGYNTHISLGNVIGADGSLIFYRFFVGSGSGEVRVQKMKWKSPTDYTNWTELTYASQVTIYTRPIG